MGDRHSMFDVRTLLDIYWQLGRMGCAVVAAECGECSGDWAVI